MGLENDIQVSPKRDRGSAATASDLRSSSLPNPDQLDRQSHSAGNRHRGRKVESDPVREHAHTYRNVGEEEARRAIELKTKLTIPEDAEVSIEPSAGRGYRKVHFAWQQDGERFEVYWHTKTSTKMVGKYPTIRLNRYSRENGPEVGLLERGNKEMTWIPEKTWHAQKAKLTMLGRISSRNEQQEKQYKEAKQLMQAGHITDNATRPAR